MKPALVARMYGHVDCGLFRLKMTAYWPAVLTLFRFERSDEIPDGSLILTTRSNVAFTSAESKPEPSLNFTPRRRVQRHVLTVPTGAQFVASDGTIFTPFSAWLRVL